MCSQDKEEKDCSDDFMFGFGIALVIMGFVATYIIQNNKECLSENQTQKFAKEICREDYYLSKTRTLECSGTILVKVVIEDRVPTITTSSPYMILGK